MAHDRKHLQSSGGKRRARRHRTPKKNCPTGKVRYTSEYEAGRALSSTARKRGSGDTSRQEVRTYFCLLCNGEHVTSQKYDPTRRTRR